MPPIDTILELLSKAAQITYSAPDQVTIDTKSTEILAANDDRLYARIMNDTSAVIYLAVGADAEMNKGIRLNATGGVFEMTRMNLSTQAINGISANGSLIVTVQEAE